MKTLSARTTLLSVVVLTTTLSVAPFASAFVNQTPGPQSTVAIGTVSASATTLDDLDNALKVKAQKMGGSHYIITSARMGNRTTGTAIVYQ